MPAETQKVAYSTVTGLNQGETMGPQHSIGIIPFSKAMTTVTVSTCQAFLWEAGSQDSRPGLGDTQP